MLETKRGSKGEVGLTATSTAGQSQERQTQTGEVPVLLHKHDVARHGEGPARHRCSPGTLKLCKRQGCSRRGIYWGTE